MYSSQVRILGATVFLPRAAVCCWAWVLLRQPVLRHLGREVRECLRPEVVDEQVTGARNL